jgi:transcriptional regulator with XRE-family HTH domain
MFDREKFASDIRNSTKRANSTRAIARRSGVTLSTVQNILRARVDMRVSTFFTLCQAYDLNPMDYALNDPEN